jgi:hypothetical protein
MGDAEVDGLLGQLRRAAQRVNSRAIAITPALSRTAGEGAVRVHAIAIARAAKRLNDLRERWLNPLEWMARVPDVVLLGLGKSPYPDRISCSLPRDRCKTWECGRANARYEHPINFGAHGESIYFQEVMNLKRSPE